MLQAGRRTSSRAGRPCRCRSVRCRIDACVRRRRLVVLKLSVVWLWEPVAFFEIVSVDWPALSPVTVVAEGMPVPVTDDPTPMPASELTQLTVFELRVVLPVAVAVLVEVVVPVSS